VFHHNEEQWELAEESQHHLAQAHLQLVLALMIYPTMKNFLNAVAVTPVNGYLGEYGSCDALRKGNRALRLSLR
jgi:hypothetical protein